MGGREQPERQILVDEVGEGTPVTQCRRTLRGGEHAGGGGPLEQRDRGRDVPGHQRLDREPGVVEGVALHPPQQHRDRLVDGSTPALEHLRSRRFEVHSDQLFADPGGMETELDLGVVGPGDGGRIGSRRPLGGGDAGRASDQRGQGDSDHPGEGSRHPGTVQRKPAHPAVPAGDGAHHRRLPRPDPTFLRAP